MADLTEFARRIPKAELHCHLVGAIPAPVAWRIASRHGIPLPTPTAETLYQYDNFHDFIDRYMRMAASFQQPGDFAEAVYAALDAGMQEGNVQYRELFFNPTDHYPGGLSYSQMLDGLIDGIAAAETDLGVRCRLIPSINRMESAQVARDLVEEVIADRREEVIGIGLDAAEPAGPPERFAAAFQRAGAGGLRRTAHTCEDYAGLEGGPPQNAITCLDVLGCERLDHGYNVLADPQVLARCRDSGVPFTVCLPGSNPVLRPARVASIAAMRAVGLPVSLHSDDPAMHRTSPAAAYELAVQALDLDAVEMADLAEAAVDAAWLDEDERRSLRVRFRTETDELGDQLIGPSWRARPED